MLKNKISWVVSVLSILNTAGPARLQNKIWLQSQKGWKVGLTKKKKKKAKARWQGVSFRAHFQY